MTPVPPFAAHKAGTSVTPIRLFDETEVQKILTRQTHAIARFIKSGGQTWIISVLKGAEMPTRLVKAMLEDEYPDLASRVRWTTIRMKGGGEGGLATVLEHSPHRAEFEDHHQFLVLDEMIDGGNTALGAIRDQAVPATSSFCYFFRRDHPQLPGSPVSLGEPEPIKVQIFPDDSPEPQKPFIVGFGTNLPAAPVEGVVADDGDDLREMMEVWAIPWASYLVRNVPQVASNALV